MAGRVTYLSLAHGPDLFPGPDNGDPRICLRSDRAGNGPDSDPYPGRLGTDLCPYHLDSARDPDPGRDLDRHWHRLGTGLTWC